MKTEHFNRIINFNNYIDYNKNSIVSKVLLQNNASVTLFAFDKGQEIETHTAPMDALVNVLDGEAQIVIADERFSLKAGDILIMPANIPHSLLAVKKFKILLTKA